MKHKENLDKLIGTWNTTGQVVDGGEHNGTKIEGTDRYEWLGESFIVHYIDVTFGDTPQKGIEIFKLTDNGFDMTAYNNDGSTENMRGSFDSDGVFHAGDEKVRTTLTFAEDGKSMEALWEMNHDGSWKSWLKMSFSKQP